MTRPTTAAAVLVAALTVAGCSVTGPDDTPTPAPTSTVVVAAPPSSTPPNPTAPATATAAPGATARPEHGNVDPTSTNEPTDAEYLSVKDISEKFVAAFYDFGFPDGYARDHLDRSQPYMTDRFFYEQLDLLEDAGANADPTWQQITRARTRSVVDIGQVLPGYVRKAKAVSRVEVRIAIVAADSHGGAGKVPAAATQQYALLTFAKVTGQWKVDNSELVRS